MLMHAVLAHSSEKHETTAGKDRERYSFIIVTHAVQWKHPIRGGRIELAPNLHVIPPKL